VPSVRLLSRMLQAETTFLRKSPGRRGKSEHIERVLEAESRFGAKGWTTVLGVVGRGEVRQPVPDLVMERVEVHRNPGREAHSAGSPVAREIRCD